MIAKTAIRVRGALTAVTYLLLTDEQDRTLVVLGDSDPQSAGMQNGDLDRVWPRSGWCDGPGEICPHLDR